MAPGSERLRVILVAALLAVATLCAYWPLQHNGFIEAFDDAVYILDNPHVRSGLRWENVGWALTSFHGGNWHPLTMISHMADVQLFGLNAGGHHLVSLLVHIVNALLLFALLRRLTGALWRAFLVAAFFALHPLHVESVAWAAERKDVLSTLFWLLAMHAYVRYTASRGRRFYALTLGLFVLGLLSKPMLVTLPFVLLLLDFWPLRRFGDPAIAGPGIGRLLLEKLPFLVLSIVASIVAVMAQRQAEAVASLDVLPLAARVLQMPVAYAGYLAKCFWPADLAVFYPLSNIWPIREAAVSSVVLAGITALAVIARRRCPWLLFGWLWFLGTLLPVIGLVQVGGQAMADRYTYMPLTGIFVMVAWAAAGIVALSRRRAVKLFAATGFALMLSACAFLTSRQLGLWQDSLTLFSHASQVTSGNVVAHKHVAALLIDRQRFAQAAAHIDTVLRLVPDDPQARTNRGIVLLHKREYAAARDLFTAVLADTPYVAAYYNLGVVYDNMGDAGRALQCYQQAIRSDSGYWKAYNNAGIIYARQREYAEAVDFFTRLLRLRPGEINAYLNRGRALLELGSDSLALADCQAAAALRPGDASLLATLGSLLAEHGLTQAALRFYRAAQAIDPGHVEARQGLTALPTSPAGRSGAPANDTVSSER